MTIVPRLSRRVIPNNSLHLLIEGKYTIKMTCNLYFSVIFIVIVIFF